MKQEFYIEKGRLITKQLWEQLITEMQEVTAEDLTDREGARKELKKAFLKAVEERLPEENFGILFSGGVDSTLIALLAHKLKKKFTCYTVGFQENNTKQPEDVIYAHKAAKQIGITLKTRILDLDEMHELFRRTVQILGPELRNVVNAGVGSVEQACIEMAKEDGIKIFFGGLGSEEIFAGYERHKQAEKKQEECWRGLKAMYERDFLRDFAIASSNKVVFSTPFLDEDLIRVAMRIPEKYKINNEFAKIIIRETAEELGMPKELAWRRKRAAQYGSRMNHALTKITQQKGFEYKKDYLESLS